MNRLSRPGIPPLPAVLLWAGAFASVAFVTFPVMAAAPAAAPAAAGARYVCPPCGIPCDTLSFNAPGVCPTCGMTLVEAGSAAAQPAPAADTKKVAILVFNGVEVIDFSGPYEMFGAAGCDVYTVAATKDPVTSAMGLTIVPKHTFADAPQPDVLVIPGGGVKGACNSAPTLQYIRDASAHTRQTMSVCNGAFILASTGLLDGLTATTTNGNIPRLAAQFPKVKVVRDQRYVDNGRIVTAAGLSAGIDGALHVIANLFGSGTAQAVALGEEYNWQSSAGYARAALADHEIPPLNLDQIGEWTLVRTQGDTSRWEIVVKGRAKVAAADFLNAVEQTLVKSQWTKLGSTSAGPASQTITWRFTGSDGKPWDGTLTVDGGMAAGAELTAGLSVNRSG